MGLSVLGVPARRLGKLRGGGEEEGVIGRLTEDRAIIAVAAEEDGKGIGRIRLRHIPDVTRTSLHGFIAEAVEPGSTVRTDGLNAYLGLEGYVHDRQVQRRQAEGDHLLPRVESCSIGWHNKQYKYPRPPSIR